MSRPAKRTRRGDGGVALVETAIALPFIALLLIGTIEAGFAWRDANVVARSVHQAARTNARIATDPLADYEALRAINSGFAGAHASSIEKVIIYDADTFGDSPPPQCRTLPPPTDLTQNQGIPNLCNVYSPAQIAADSPGSFGSCSGTWDADFCPANRNRDGDDPDRIGVWVEVRFDEVTSVVPGSVHFTRGAVYQIEPCIAGDTTC